MGRFFFINLTVISAIFLALLLGGCASQPKKSNAPEPLVDEMKSIEGSKSIEGYATTPSASKEEGGGFSDGKTTYIVKKGDTLWHISKKYGVSVQAITTANHISNTKDLKVGRKLIIPVSGKSYPLDASQSTYTPASNVSGGKSTRGFIWPVKGHVISQFGETRNGVKNIGIVILPQSNQRLVASKKGTVEAVSDADDGIHVIVIKHEGGCRTLYESRCNPVVGEGSYIEQGQPIAYFNEAATGKQPELNFKIYVKDKPVNPMSYLP